MWTYSAYILWKFAKKLNCDEFSFGKFARFIFDILWKEQHLSFYDGKADLFEDLKYLKKLHVIELTEEEDLEKVEIKIKDKKKLKIISGIVEDSSILTGVKLLDEYVRRINLAIETLEKEMKGNE